MIVSDVSDNGLGEGSIVEELASNCTVFGGTYFPSYGGIFQLTDRSEALYKKVLERAAAVYLLMGATSFRVETGPYAQWREQAVQVGVVASCC